MARKNKLQRFADNLSFPNVYENFDVADTILTGKDGIVVDMCGKWNENHFKNTNPLVLELACGNGEYCVGMSKLYPERNFLGVDIKGARIWNGAKLAIAEGMENTAFLRTRIEMIHKFFAPEEVSEIWITFPDPFLRESKSNRRLTSPPFLNLYRQILKKGGIVHLKTDEPNLYECTLEWLAEDENVKILYHDNNIYTKPLPLPELAIKTRYEALDIAGEKTIKYIQFTIN
jgi:tRNA (guanine-N7-)-methyltransferase